MSDEKDDSPTVIGADLGAMPQPIDFLLAAAKSVLEAVDDKLDNGDAPLKWMVPWARLTLLRTAVLRFRKDEGAIVKALRAELANSVPRSRVEAMELEIKALDAKLQRAYDGGEQLGRELSASKAENEQLRELLNTYNLGGWMDSERLIKDRDALAERVKTAEASLSALQGIARRLVENDRHLVLDYDVDGLSADAIKEHESTLEAARQALGETGDRT